MRFMIMHKTNAHWESGATPGPDLIARVGQMIGELAEAGVLLGAEGLRASSEGVRLHFSGGELTVTPGPFEGRNELPAGFVIVEVASLDEAVEWASRLAAVVGDVEIDVRPVTEPWDLGVVPKPEGLTTRRYMAVHKADARSEAGIPDTQAQVLRMERLADEMTRAGVLRTAERLAPSSKGKRYRMPENPGTAGVAGGVPVVLDGPFAESKELIAGYVIVSASSLEAAMPLASRYIDAVGCTEVDLLPLADGTGS